MHSRLAICAPSTCRADSSRKHSRGLQLFFRSQIHHSISEDAWHSKRTITHRHFSMTWQSVSEHCRCRALRSPVLELTSTGKSKWPISSYHGVVFSKVHTNITL